MIGPIHHQGKWGFLSRAGEFVIPPIYEGLGNCREDRIGFVADGKLGFLNTAGEVVIHPQFEPEKYITPHFSEELCAVRLGGKVGYIDPTGAWAIQPLFLYGWDFRGGKCVAETDGEDAHFCVMDRAGRKITELKVYDISYFQDWPATLDRFPVLVARPRNEPWLVEWINWRGDIIFDAKYPWMNNWWEGIAGFCPDEEQIGHAWGLVRSSGEVVAQPQFYLLGEFTEGLAPAGRTPTEFGFINPQGEWVIEPKYRHAQSFSEGLAFVTVKGKHGFINTKGEMVIEPQFRRASNFQQGYAQVEYDGKSAVIDETGHVIWECFLV